jgi:hypothetical protein
MPEKPKRQKNDCTHAEAICEAVGRPAHAAMGRTRQPFDQLLAGHQLVIAPWQLARDALSVKV